MGGKHEVPETGQHRSERLAHLPGCMTYGEPNRGNHARTLPEESSRPLLKQALEAGINFFDTANSYSDGSSEEILGRALHDYARREDVVVATKVYFPLSNLKRGLSRANIMQSIDDSLRRGHRLCRFAADPPLGLRNAAGRDAGSAARRGESR